MQRLAGETLDLIGSPARLAANAAEVYQALNRAVSLYRVEMNLSEAHYLVSEYKLTTSPNLDEYPVSPPDWGDPIICESCADGWPNDVPYSRFEVDFVSVEDQQDYRPERRPVMADALSQATGGLPWSLTWWKTVDGQVKLRFAPQSAMANRFRFRILYMPVGAVNFRRDSPPEFIALFYDLLSSRAAFLLLPKSGWESEEYQRYQQVVTDEMAQRAAQLRRWLDSNSAQQSGFTEGYRGSTRGRSRRW